MMSDCGLLIADCRLKSEIENPNRAEGEFDEVKSEFYWYSIY
jgi:hypothetical protein